MKATATALPGVLVLEPAVFRDARGLFFESFNQRAFDEAVGRHVEFVQDNHSSSQRGVLRGLHYQLPPHAQGKLVRVVRGSAFDVVVDIRRDSPTFRRWLGVTLDAESQRQVWIPAGFAHGFISLQDDTVFLYKTTDFYAKECERSILWSDPELAIGWPDVGAPPLLAAKDAAAPVLAQADLF
ncbi:MAG TPA: dTDP-4-dehydrorhamnose 3,5-epimerase [Burkholderiaceae bacterium]